MSIQQQDNTICFDERICMNSERVHLQKGDRLYARNYIGFNVFLVRGRAEISYRGCVDKIEFDDKKSVNNKSLFNIYDHGQYVRCASECEFLIVNKLGSSFLEDISTPENIISSNISLVRDLDEWNIHPFSDRASEAKQKNSESYITEVNTHDNNADEYKELVKKYERLKRVNKNLVTLINEKDKENSSGSIINENKVSYKKHNKKVVIKDVIDRKVPAIFKGLIQCIQSNLRKSVVEPKNVGNNNTFLKMDNHDIKKHEWLKMNEAYPAKTGLYYITDGKKVSVAYFNLEKKVFYMTSELDIRLWSTKKVTLPQ